MHFVCVPFIVLLHVLFYPLMIFDKYIVTFLSDNGPHYHNSGVLFYLTEVNGAFNINLKECNYFEAGEGKSQRNSHFTHISHKIVRWVRMGNDLESNEQVADLIKVNNLLIMYMYVL